MDVRVVCALPPSNFPETDYVRVHTYTDPLDDTVTLATIERVVDKANADADAKKPRKRIKTLITRRPMSPGEALSLATLYAEHKQISIVYTDR